MPPGAAQSAKFSDDELFADAVRVVVANGKGSSSLIQRKLSVGYNRAARLLDEFRKVAEQAPAELVSVEVGDLSERELEVLRLLAAGLSNPEIAERLVVAVSTVRSHCKSIYGKLGVHRRWDAVQRARALGLIETAGT